MARKKKGNRGGTAKKAPLSPQNYIRKCVPTLPIDKCYRIFHPENEHTICIFILRRETSGDHAIGAYLIDTWCRGVYRTFAECHLSNEDVEDKLNTYRDIDPETLVEEITYPEAHNMILGAIEFAEEAGILPHKDFKLTQALLEEDTDDIPLIEYEFGRNGKHVLECSTLFEFNTNCAILEKNLSPDQYELIYPWYEDYDDEYDDEYFDDEYFDDEYDDDDLDDEDDDEDAYQDDDQEVDAEGPFELFCEALRRYYMDYNDFLDLPPQNLLVAECAYLWLITRILKEDELPTPAVLKKIRKDFDYMKEKNVNVTEDELQKFGETFVNMLIGVRKKHEEKVGSKTPMHLAYDTMITLAYSVYTVVEDMDLDEIEAEKDAFVEIMGQVTVAATEDYVAYVKKVNEMMPVIDQRIKKAGLL